MRRLASWLLLAPGGCALVLASAFGADNDARTADDYSRAALQRYFDALSSRERDDSYRGLAEQLFAQLESDAAAEEDPAAGLRAFLLVPARLQQAFADDLASIDAPPHVAEAHAEYVAAIRAAVAAQERFADQLRGPDALEKLFGELSRPKDAGQDRIVILGEPGNRERGEAFAFTDKFTADEDAIEIPGLREAQEAMAEACREMKAIADRHEIDVEMQCAVKVDLSNVEQ